MVKKKYLHVPHVGHQCGKTVYLKDIWQIKNYNDLGLNVFYQSAIKKQFVYSIELKRVSSRFTNFACICKHLIYILIPLL